MVDEVFIEAPWEWAFIYWWFALMGLGAFAFSLLCHFFLGEKYKDFEELGFIVAPFATLIGVIILIVELGRPDRAMNIFLSWFTEPEKPQISLFTIEATWYLIALPLQFITASFYIEKFPWSRNYKAKKIFIVLAGIFTLLALVTLPLTAAVIKA